MMSCPSLLRNGWVLRRAESSPWALRRLSLPSGLPRCGTADSVWALATGQWLTSFFLKWLDIFPKKPRKHVFLIVGSPVRLNMVLSPISPLKAWRLEQQSNPWLFSKMRKVLRWSMWECNAPSCDSCFCVIMFNQRTHVTITKVQSHHP